MLRNAWEDCQSDCPRECVRWVEASDGDIPPEAYKAGLPEYVVRAQHDGGIYPGTFLPQLGEVDIPWRGQIISKSKYQVLLITNIIPEILSISIRFWWRILIRTAYLVGWTKERKNTS